MSENEDKYVVKVRRYYGPNEATSVVYGPTTRRQADTEKWMLANQYQSTQYYVEKWENDYAGM